MKSRQIFITYLIITTLFLSGVAMSFWDYSYAGYYTDKLINWLWLLSTLFVIIRFWKRRIAKGYFYALVLLVVLSFIPMAIPFFGMICYFSTIEDYQQIDLNNTYRLERTRHQPMSMTRIYIYENKGIVEKNIYRTAYSDILEYTLKLDPMKVYEIKETETEIQKATLISANRDSLGIEYQILNKKAVYYHKFNDDGY